MPGALTGRLRVRMGATMACRAEPTMVAMEARAEKEPMKSVAQYFAHTATLPDGKRDPDQGHWQPLSTHLRNVPQTAKEFVPDYVEPFRDRTARTRPRTTSSRLYWNWCST